MTVPLLLLRTEPRWGAGKEAEPVVEVGREVRYPLPAPAAGSFGAGGGAPGGGHTQRGQDRDRGRGEGESRGGGVGGVAGIKPATF